MSPWEYLEDWTIHDREVPGCSIDTLNDQMQQRYPGKYIVKSSWHLTSREYELTIVFNSPNDETIFRIKYS